MKQYREITSAVAVGLQPGQQVFTNRTPPGFAGDMYETDWEATFVQVAQTAARNTTQHNRRTAMPSTVLNDPAPFEPLPAATAPTGDSRRIPIIPLGTSLGAFLSLTFVLCVLFDLWFPSYAMNAVWTVLLPGFTWISWPSFFLGLIETFAYGWYFALLFGGIYNFMLRRPGGRSTA